MAIRDWPEPRKSDIGRGKVKLGTHQFGVRLGCHWPRWRGKEALNGCVVDATSHPKQSGRAFASGTCQHETVLPVFIQSGPISSAESLAGWLRIWR
jgi:hypothetical protein